MSTSASCRRYHLLGDDGDAEWEFSQEDFEEEEKPTRKQLVEKISLGASVKPIRGKPRPQRFCTFDLETWRWEKPYLASSYDGKETVTFESEPEGAPWLRGRDPGPSCVSQFLDWFLRKERAGVVCYAHNGGKFDFLFVLWELTKGRGFFERGFQWKILPIQSGIFRLNIWHPSLGTRLVGGKPRWKTSWVFSDSIRLLKMTLDQVGSTFGVARKTDLRAELGLPALPKNATRAEKLKANSKVFEELAKPQNRTLAIKYNRLDCKILYDGLKAYETQLHKIGGEMKATTPSSSVDTFRRKYQRNEIFTNKHIATCPELGQVAKACRGCGHEAIRRAHAGGRTEIYTMSGESLHYYDYNSHYLSCMAEHMPSEIATVIEGGTEAQVFKSAKTAIGIIECEVEIPEDCYLPPLPWKERVGGSSAKLLFPVGDFSGSWDTQELKLLPLVGGRITKVHRQIWMGSSDVFGDFVGAIWEFRRNGSTPAIRELAKLLGNGNYGKWAQRPEGVEYFIEPTMEQVLARELVPYAGLETLGVFIGESESEPKHIAPALSVHICSIARSRLWMKNFEVLARGGRIFYSDTDSTMVAGYHQEDSKELGGMKLEHHIRRASFHLPKTYEFQCFPDCPGKDCKDTEHTIKAKGVGRGLGVPIDYDDWKRMINTTFPPERRKVERQRMSQFKESFRAHARSKKQFPFVINQPKGILSSYTKRTILADGVNTVPRIARENTIIS